MFPGELTESPCQAPCVLLDTRAARNSGGGAAYG
jgi:hypothetical protein